MFKLATPLPNEGIHSFYHAVYHPMKSVMTDV